VVLALAMAGSTSALAQGSATSSLSGTVVDSSGAVIPGATISAKNKATNSDFTTVSADQGSFTIPAMPPGTYTVTVSLMGFKTVVLNDVVLNAAVPATVRAVLEVGTLSETVVVEGASAIVQTQSSAISTTIDVNQISNLPLVSRSVLDFVTFLPGVSTPDSNRSSTINGLPQSTINITLDGVNIQDNTLKTTDGFFAIVSPRLDAIEEVTVTTAAQGANSAGQGAAQIRFVTRSGTNTFTGSAYHYFRADWLNANTWFNIRDNVAKPELLQNQPGVRFGGPLTIPGLFNGHDKAFFFVNYEEFIQPQTISETRTVLSPAAQAGIFRYNTSAGVREVNLLALAAANGQTATFDPTVQRLLADVRAAVTSTGSITDLEDPNLQRFSYNYEARNHNYLPTVRLDWNVSTRHRLSGSLHYQWYNSVPDTTNNREPNFPGFPVTGSQTSERIGFSSTLRSTLTSNLVNEFLAGISGAPVQFSDELSPGMWNGSVANQAGYQLNISTANITNASSGPTPSSRNATSLLLENSLSWLKHTHSFSLGGSFNQNDVWIKNQTLVPTIDFDIVTGDPADAMFTSTNFQGSSATNRTDAGDLYAVLVGRVSAINREARLDESSNQYILLGPSTQRARLRDIAFWAQDSWRLRPALTVNFGVRYELQLPFYALNDSYSTTTLADVWGRSGLSDTCTDMSSITPETCNLFKPGLQPGKTPEFVQASKNQRAYNMDVNNFAPSVGAAWTPTAESGWLRRVIGQQGDTVLRGGFARSFNRPGMSDFTGRIDDNPGIQITANRSLALGNLGALPVLFRDNGRLGAPDYPQTRVYPMTDVVTGDIAVYDPDIQVPYADSWTFGYQRALNRTMAMEIRYVGTRSRDLWTTYNLNEININENGFLDEFRLAQRNLQAHVLSGCGTTGNPACSFAYRGPGTGTSPLPIFLAYFSGLPAAQAGDASRYTSSNFTSSTFINPLASRNPNPFTSADALDGDAGRRDNALRAGLPANFLVANPDLLGGAEIDGNGGYTNYNSLQLELRRRMSQGLQFQASYVYGRALESAFYSFRVPRKERFDTGTEGGTTHAFKVNWVYELPFGRGKRFANDHGTIMDLLVGGWQVHGTARVQSGQLVDFGNVRLVGMTDDDLRGLFEVREDGNRKVWMLPQDVIDNTLRAFSVSATSPTGYSELGAPQGRYFAPANGPDCIESINNNYGDCGRRTIVAAGPMFKNVDLSITKLIPIKGRVRGEFRVEMLNAFNLVNFAPVTGIGSVATAYEVTGLNGEVTRRIIQLVSRVSW
jgi:hypothetical protein